MANEAQANGTAILRTQILTGTLMVTASSVFHVACLTLLLLGLRWMEQSVGFSGWFVAFALFGFCVLFVVVVHGIGAWIWAWAYCKLSEFDDLPTALYFSVVSSTTLGYGDFTLSKRWRLLASFQAMGGLILFAASTAFLIDTVRLTMPVSTPP